LQSTDRVAEPHDRHVSEEVQRNVYSRDNNTCRICGWNFDRWSSEDPRFLELHHLEHHQHGGENIEQNLIVACNKCHDQIHSGKHAESIDKIVRSL